LLRKEAAAQGKEYAYYFNDVSGGETSISRGDPNVFNVNPLVVYRIYTDGRPDELVRGVRLIGTPLAVFSQIEYCGREVNVFNGMCGAESGWVPVSSVSPALLVKKVETQKNPKSEAKPPILPEPQGADVNAGNAAEVIPEAIRKELKRNLDSLQLAGLNKPFFISSRIYDAQMLNVLTENGSLTQSHLQDNRYMSNRLLVGDYRTNNGNYQNDDRNAYFSYGTVGEDNNEKSIRAEIWTDLDAKYKTAAETYEQKQSALKNLNIPQKERDLPDWDRVPQVNISLAADPDTKIDRKFYEDYAVKISSVFNEYPALFDSRLHIFVTDGINYFANTENSTYQLPYSYITLSATVHIQTKDGEDINRNLLLAYNSKKDLPSVDEIRKKFRTLAERTIEEATAPKLEDAYTGPVLFEDDAVWRSFHQYLVSNLKAVRRNLTPAGFSDNPNNPTNMEDLVGKRIAAKGLNIEDLTGSKEYGGVKLPGYVPVDAQGVVPPAKLTLVENGILKNLLSDRIPTHKAPRSNGHSIIGYQGLSEVVSSGIFRISDTIVKSRAELKAELLRLAKDEGYDYAYIIRDWRNQNDVDIYRVNADGSETRVRSALLSDFDRLAFRKILAASDREAIYSNNSNFQTLMSAIVPEAVLFEDLQIIVNRSQTLGKAPVVVKE
jgi:predicted Zn-dependent protease